MGRFDVDAGYRADYGGGLNGAEMARRIAVARGLSLAQAEEAIRPAGVEHLRQLVTARPAVTYYACRLLAEATP